MTVICPAKTTTLRPSTRPQPVTTPVAEDLALVHVEVGAAVDHEAVDLDEGAGIEEQVHPLTGGELAGLVLLGDARGAAALQREAVHLVEARPAPRRV